MSKLSNNINFVIDNFDKLKDNLGKDDLVTLQKALEVLKNQTRLRLVEKALNDNDGLRQSIADAISQNTKEIARLTEEISAVPPEEKFEPVAFEPKKFEPQEFVPGTYKPSEFVVPEHPEGVASGLYSSLLQQAKKQYENNEKQRKFAFEQSEKQRKVDFDVNEQERRASFNQTENQRENKHMIDEQARRDTFDKSVRDKRSRIAALQREIKTLERYNAELANPESFIKALFTDIIEKNITGPVAELINTCAINMAQGYMSMEHFGGENIFNHVDTRSNFSGYAVNEQVAERFIGFIRDEELVAELVPWSKANIKVQKLENILMDESRYRSIESEYVRDVKTAVDRMSRLKEEISKLEKESKSPVKKAFSLFKKQEDHSAETRLNEAKNTLDKLEMEIRQNARENEHGKVAMELISDEAFMAKPVEERDAIIADKAKKSTEEYKVSLETQLEAAVKERATAFEQLSAKSREYIESGLIGGVQDFKKHSSHFMHSFPRNDNISEIKERYVDVKGGNVRYGVSPYVSSLVLEAIVKGKNMSLDEVVDIMRSKPDPQLLSPDKFIESMVAKAQGAIVARTAPIK